MLKRRQSWGVAMGVSTSILLTSVLTTIGMSGGALVTYAAEEQTRSISQEEAIQAAKKWVTIPADYKLERASFLDAKRDPFSGTSSWRIAWEDTKSNRIMVTIDAASSKLLQYSYYRDKVNTTASQKKLSSEQALSIAEEFLQRVTTSEERQKLSKPNEFGPLYPYFFQQQAIHHFSFTRMENEIPFLENGFQIVLDQEGQLTSFSREWYDGKLPATTQVISAEEGQKLLAEQAKPSLVFANQASVLRSGEPGSDLYMLIYRFDENDPQFVDAISGKVINAVGTEAVERKIQPLGTTVVKNKGEERIITKEEAQKIAEQIIKKFPGSYRFEGSYGSGSSTGADGVRRQNWDFSFTPLQGKADSEERVELTIGDRGELKGYEAREGARFRERGRKFTTVIPWGKAEANAIQLVKMLYADRLGEMFLLPSPSAEEQKQLIERGESYGVRFGWLKDGVEIQSMYTEVIVDPETGEAEGLRAPWDELPVNATEKSLKATIDHTKANQIMQKQKEFMLTYYQPQYTSYGFPSQPKEPLLIYRYVGDEGVVDAVSGQWVSYAEAEKNRQPQDIDEHPQKAALEFAVRMDLLTAKDGKLEPEKAVTRGEMAQILTRLTNRYEFRNLGMFYEDDEDQTYQFTDVDMKNAYYPAIQKAIRYGIIAKEGNTFNPDRAITRIEAADMLARLFGYGSLLEKTDIFITPYTDLQKKQVPAVALVNAKGILAGKSPNAFSPNESLTRAEVAQLVQTLYEQTQKK
ncbi:YcdB/YcdC domain-containing protein [Brevibacillus reuszeri]|uniref:YcdB/YcdC domain-containing protein n=1 Tax=Brevibacillus reuszeri TaxID=54915 RepID=UPI001F3FAE4A|nr:YcdB/YcdC domain-containing protein [Brevibacillus reuszeri]